MLDTSLSGLDTLGRLSKRTGHSVHVLSTPFMRPFIRRIVGGPEELPKDEGRGGTCTTRVRYLTERVGHLFVCIVRLLRVVYTLVCVFTTVESVLDTHVSVLYTPAGS